MSSREIKRPMDRSSAIPTKISGIRRPAGNLHKEIEELRYAVESATVEREIAEEKLETNQRELQEARDQLADAMLKIDMLQAEKENDSNLPAQSAESAVFQLQKQMDRNANLEQAIVKLRDLLAEKVQKAEEMDAEIELLKLSEANLEEAQIEHLEKIKALEEQVDASQSAQDMVESLTQQKTSLEDKCKKLQEEVDFMEESCRLNEEMLETALSENKNLLLDVDRLNVQLSETGNKQRDMTDYLVGREQAVVRLEELNRQLQREIEQLKGQCQETQSIEQQKHQIENVAYKLNFSESKMAEKEAELTKCKRNLSSMEEQMKSLSDLTKAQSTKIDELKLQLDARTGEVDELKRTLKDRIEKNEEMLVRRDRAESKLQTVQSTLEASEAKVAALELRIKALDIQYDNGLNQLSQDINELTAQRDELKERLSKMNVNMSKSSIIRPAIMSPVERVQDQSSTSIISIQSASEHTTGMQQSSLCSDPPPTGDKSVLIDTINSWKRAFDLMSRQNLDLKMKLASVELNGRFSPSALESHSVQAHPSAKRLRPDHDQLETLKAEVNKFKHQVRQSIIEDPLFTRGKSIRVQAQNHKFKSSQLTSKFRALQNDVHYVLSNSSLVRQQFAVAS